MHEQTFVSPHNTFIFSDGCLCSEDWFHVHNARAMYMLTANSESLSRFQVSDMPNCRSTWLEIGRRTVTLAESTVLAPEAAWRGRGDLEHCIEALLAHLPIMHALQKGVVLLQPFLLVPSGSEALCLVRTAMFRPTQADG